MHFMDSELLNVYFDFAVTVFRYDICSRIFQKEPRPGTAMLLLNRYR